ncbi:MAG: dimethylhistidine N-methyltransferase [Betaproteobacteria bacterium RIFCSPLOWO2_12_FULL_65_14]|nr:MAG: dimethylhistidine N-methyltransferase [Betaproteobacteria bacterium RIFCSPLOWO2_12_FULL_65_14]
MTLQSGPTFFSFPADAPEGGSEQSAIIAGLMAKSPRVSPKYLYGPLGSRLFDAITELPEYYPTRTERAVLEACRESIARAAGPEPTLIDLGAGNCEKARSLFQSLKPRQYVAVDMSVEFLRHSMSHLQRDFPHLEMLGIGIDFSSGLRLPDAVRRENRLFFYPGSSIGNFTPEQALVFLAGIRDQCPSGGLLIGVDLIKSESILQAAYDDALGVTAAFNLNLLNNLNALIGSDFAVGDWRHYAVFNIAQSRIEMHLEARRDTTVHWPGGARRFAQGERIHTENSYKYALEDFKALLRRAGFGEVRAWTDERDWFALCHAAA